MPKSYSDTNGSGAHKNGGRTVKFTSPHSPFQQLLDQRRLEISATRESKGQTPYSVRKLAVDLGICQSTLWLWLHNEKGYPAPKSFDANGMLGRISQVMEIPRAQLAWALDQSRRRYTGDDLERVPSLPDAFASFIEYLEKMLPKRQVPLSPLITTAKRMYFGAKVGEQANEDKAGDPSTEDKDAPKS